MLNLCFAAPLLSRVRSPRHPNIFYPLMYKAVTKTEMVRFERVVRVSPELSVANETQEHTQKRYSPEEVVED